jgi:hypothetical protein
MGSAPWSTCGRLAEFQVLLLQGSAWPEEGPVAPCPLSRVHKNWWAERLLRGKSCRGCQMVLLGPESSGVMLSRGHVLVLAGEMELGCIPSWQPAKIPMPR